MNFPPKLQAVLKQRGVRCDAKVQDLWHWALEFECSCGVAGRHRCILLENTAVNKYGIPPWVVAALFAEADRAGLLSSMPALSETEGNRHREVAQKLGKAKLKDKAVQTNFKRTQDQEVQTEVEDLVLHTLTKVTLATSTMECNLTRTQKRRRRRVLLRLQKA